MIHEQFKGKLPNTFYLFNFLSKNFWSGGMFLSCLLLPSFLLQSSELRTLDRRQETQRVYREKSTKLRVRKPGLQSKVMPPVRWMTLGDPFLLFVLYLPYNEKWWLWSSYLLKCFDWRLFSCSIFSSFHIHGLNCNRVLQVCSTFQDTFSPVGRCSVVFIVVISWNPLIDQ